MASTCNAKANDSVLSRTAFLPRGRAEDRFVQTFAEGPVVPRWLSVLHRLVTLMVFIAVCLATVAVVAALVYAGRVCYERTAHAARGLHPSTASIHSPPNERP